MDTTGFQQWFERDGARMLEVVRALPAEAPVPTCPGWTVGDLVTHTAQVYEHKLAAIELAGPAPDPWPPVWPADRDPVAWLADAHARLLARLRSTPPDAVSWTWDTSDRTVGFWSRRMAHEVAVHRVDAESAAGTPTPLDPDLGEDGAAELLDLFLGGDWSDEPQPGSTGSIEVRAGARSWHVTLTPEQVDVRDGGGPADLVVAAAPSDLDLWLWGRRPDDAVRIEGDPAVAERFRARLVLATQ